MIFIDSREKAPIKQLASDYLAAKKIETDIIPLNTGDYWVVCDSGKVVCIERKVVADLFYSIKQDRLIKQCATMLEHFDHVRLVIQGPIYKAIPNTSELTLSSTSSGNHFNVLDVRRMIGTLSTIQSAGVIVDWWPLSGEFGAYLHHIKLAYEKNWHESETVKPRTISFKRPKRFEDEIKVLGIPGVGNAKAKLVAAHYGNLGQLCSADHSTLISLFGDRIGTNIYHYLHGEPITVFKSKASKMA